MFGCLLEFRALRGDAREGVFHHFVRNTGFTQLIAELLVFRHRHLLKTDQHRGPGVLKLFDECLEVLLFLFPCLHCFSSSYLANAASSSSTPGLIVEARFTFLTYLPFAVAGFAFTSASSNAFAFSRSLSFSSDSLPTPTSITPVLSSLYA